MENEQIESAKRKFDPILHTDAYRRIHSDEAHLEKLLDLFELQPDGRYLDLGTGNGYLAFALTEKNEAAFIEGLDIVEGSIVQNQRIAHEKGFDNVKFQTYGGVDFPYPDGFFSGGISRYALHHFPNVRRSIGEIYRVLQENGFFILSDAKTYDIDRDGFIDAFQKFLEDGHEHFYYEQEIIELFKDRGFAEEKAFHSHIRYPRRFDERYRELIDNASEEVVDKYEIEVVDDLVFVTAQVMNIFFRKTGP
ncbi:MAG: class I SAM-dependent methyltransferase [Anaerolineales bacterium]